MDPTARCVTCVPERQEEILPAVPARVEMEQADAASRDSQHFHGKKIGRAEKCLDMA